MLTKRLPAFSGYGRGKTFENFQKSASVLGSFSHLYGPFREGHPLGIFGHGLLVGHWGRFLAAHVQESHPHRGPTVSVSFLKLPSLSLKGIPTMRSSFKTFLTVVVTMCAGIGQGHAADLMYVTLTNKTVVTYDISLANATAIQNSVQTFATYSVGTNPYGGITFDTAGNLYVAREGTFQIFKYNPQGQLTNTFSTPKQPSGLAVTVTGDLLYSSDVNNQYSIDRLNASGNFVSGISPGFDPYGLAVDSSGNTYVANISGNNIAKYDSSGQLLTTIGNSSNLNNPLGVALEPVMHFYQ